MNHDNWPGPLLQPHDAMLIGMAFNPYDARLAAIS